MAGKKEEISHSGIIRSITPETTVVEIVSHSACSSCHAKNLCGVGDSVTKEIEVPTSGWDNYNIGDEVEVVLKASMGHKAVWIAYAVPLVVLVVALFAATACGAGELVAGLCAIAAVALYYLVIWAFRDRLRNEYVFTIRNNSK